MTTAALRLTVGYASPHVMRVCKRPNRPHSPPISPARPLTSFPIVHKRANEAGDRRGKTTPRADRSSIAFRQSGKRTFFGQRLSANFGATVGKSAKWPTQKTIAIPQ
jgi:hypothetical protein